VRDFLQVAAQWGSQTALVVRAGGDALAGVLDRFRIDAIKLDRLFEADTAGYADGADSAESITEAARQAQVSIIAEHVDTADRQAVARTLGCDLGQGSLYGPPEDPGDLLAGIARTAAEWPA
jgi:EAL domain-containing protein (putative c-di-GMP-specific phosphodiesterase class I)